MDEAELWQEPPVLRRERLHVGGVAEIRLLETHDKMDEMVEWMVPTSTGQVESHIDGRFSSMRVCSVSAEVQPVLISTSLISILSSIVAISVISRRRPPRPRSPPAGPPLDLRTAKTTQRVARVDEKTADPHSGRIERPAARAGAGEGGQRRARAVTAEAARESSRSGLGALKSTGSRRRVPRSASPARAASRQRASYQLQPAPAPDLGRYRPAAPASPIICRGSSQFVALDRSGVVAY